MFFKEVQRNGDPGRNEQNEMHPADVPQRQDETVPRLFTVGWMLLLFGFFVEVFHAFLNSKSNSCNFRADSIIKVTQNSIVSLSNVSP